MSRVSVKTAAAESLSSARARRKGALGLGIGRCGHATAAMFGLSGESLIDWLAAKVPALQKELPVVQE